MYFYSEESLEPP